MERAQIAKRIEELKAKKEELQLKANNAYITQLAIKLLLNSVYGATGTKYFPLYDLDIAEATTIGGKTATKEMVNYVNKYLNRIINSDQSQNFIVAGDTDSVVGSTVLNGKTIEEIFIEAKRSGEVDHLQNGTEVVFPKQEHCFSLGGLTKILNVSRHRVSKERWMVSVGNQEAEMTCDHSVMVYRDGEVIEVKPSQIKRSDCLIAKSK